MPGGWVRLESDDELLAGKGGRLEGANVVAVSNGPLDVPLGELSAGLLAEMMLPVDMPEGPFVGAVESPGSVEFESGYGAVVK